jgi:hypothetical protein
MKKRILLIVLSSFVLSALILSACGAAAPTSVSDRGLYTQGEMAIGAPIAAEEAAPSFAGEFDAAGGGDFAAPAAAERLVIRNANLSIVVDAPEQRLDEIAAMAEQMDGFVVSSNVYKTDYGTGVEVPVANITIRVPAERLQEALDEIREGAIDVPTFDESGQDVTAEYTDLQSRLRNLESAEVLLRQIMEEATRTEDILNAFNQLNSITEQIEVLKGQIQYYEESAALSAISVQIIANESVQPIEVGPWSNGGAAKDAIESLVRFLQDLAEAIVWFGLYVGPILAIIGIPAWLVWRGVRWWTERRGKGKRK